MSIFITYVITEHTVSVFDHSMVVEFSVKMKLIETVLSGLLLYLFFYSKIKNGLQTYIFNIIIYTHEIYSIFMVVASINENCKD